MDLIEASGQIIKTVAQAHRGSASLTQRIHRRTRKRTADATNVLANDLDVIAQSRHRLRQRVDLRAQVLLVGVLSIFHSGNRSRESVLRLAYRRSRIPATTQIRRHGGETLLQAAGASNRGVQIGDCAVISRLRDTRNHGPNGVFQAVAHRSQAVGLLAELGRHRIKGIRGGAAGGLGAVDKLVDPVAHAFVARLRCIERRTDRVADIADRGLQIAGDVAVTRTVAQNVHSRTSVFQDGIRGLHQRHGGLHQRGQRTSSLRPGAQPRGGVINAVLYARQCLLGVGGVQVLIQRGDCAQTNAGDDLRKVLINLLNNATRALARNDRRQRVLLLIRIERQLRRLGTADVEGHQFGTEVLRKHDCRVVVTGLGAIDGVIGIRNPPVNVVITAQLRQHLIAQVEVNRTDIRAMATVITGDRNLQLLGVLKRLPAGQHVKAGEQQRNQHQTENHDAGHRVLADHPKVVPHNFKNVSH